ncbi:TonB-dependent receptor [Novosphingobium marinum]|uniref:Iron complex outermembrane receptor protein n=1 Tax=Novosphingobium marinum TaxID=1514948 RepID=A0A7Y9XVJ5_9SPHN|nr:TonB-dependent receptor [Novosphingobium marinum]NYH93958.1 iron complex outermembrane receptor protein [Novosphingobium marinum]GGC18563.1 TonB-dependent receptor [Novosphingobium marinum]
MKDSARFSSSLLAIAAAAAAVPAAAQDNTQGDLVERTAAGAEIVVTARKRNETLISVPVAVTAFTGENLEKRGIDNVDGLAANTPALVVGEGGGTVQGGSIALRGISASDSNPFGDQAVSFNIDGVPVARASVRRMGEFDLQQVEVLKGPQALFYGKNSPGGVITLRTADPTDVLAAKISAGYEFEAREWVVDGFISAPLTDSLGVRVAGYYSDMKGWVTNTIPDSAQLQPNTRRMPQQEDWGVRGTLQFDNGGPFDATLKVTYGERSGDASTANVQFVNCPLGSPQNGAIDDCTADDRVSVADLGPGYDEYAPEFGDGTTFLNQEQLLGSLVMNLDLNDSLTLTSVTGYYDVYLRNLGNFTASYVPSGLLPSLNRMDITELSQELRLTTNFGGPVEFVFGGFLQDSEVTNGSHTFLGAPGSGPVFPLEVNQYLLQQDGFAWSIFLSTSINLTETVELSGGMRYSHEKKKLDFLLSDPNGATPVSRTTGMVDVTPVVDSRTFSNLSPEATLSWRPNANLTVYGSYKEGFLSGGFNSGATNFATNLTYEPQIVRGFEAGVKAITFDNQLRLGLAAYTYEITDLQVQVTVEGVIQRLTNAGSVRSKGIEFDFDFSPRGLDGLTLFGALAYSDGKYTDYQGNCYRGQNANSPVPCVPQVSRQTGATILAQDLSGTELIRTPEWAASAGFIFEQEVSSALKIGLTGDVQYSDSYVTDATSSPGGRSPSYTLVNGSISVGTADDRYTLSLIGRNLTEEYYWTRTSDAPFTGTAPGAVPGVLGDSVSSINRGREIMLRATFRY